MEINRPLVLTSSPQGMELLTIFKQMIVFKQKLNITKLETYTL